MTDLLSFLGAPAAGVPSTPGAKGAPAAATGDLFAALLDDVLTQVAAVNSALGGPAAPGTPSPVGEARSASICTAAYGASAASSCIRWCCCSSRQAR